MKYAVCCLLVAAGLHAQAQKSETTQQFECYVQGAEARMDARKAFLLADSGSSLSSQIVRSQKVRTLEANGPKPHKLPGPIIPNLPAGLPACGAAVPRSGCAATSNSL